MPPGSQTLSRNQYAPFFWERAQIRRWPAEAMGASERSVSASVRVSGKQRSVAADRYQDLAAGVRQRRSTGLGVCDGQDAIAMNESDNEAGGALSAARLGTEPRTTTDRY